MTDTKEDVIGRLKSKLAFLRLAFLQGADESDPLCIADDLEALIAHAQAPSGEGRRPINEMLSEFVEEYESREPDYTPNAHERALIEDALNGFWHELEQAGHIAIASSAPIPSGGRDDHIKHMVGRFLSWRLPEDFSPDAGISFKKMFNENTPHSPPMKHEPQGTNLFDARQAEAMIRHMLEGLPVSSPPSGEAVRALADMTDILRRIQDTLAQWLDPGGDLQDPMETVNAVLFIADHKDTLAKQRNALAVISASPPSGPGEGE